MKTFYPLLFFVLLSCETYVPQRAFVPRQNSLSDVPVRPHNRNVDILLNNELPKEPYYKIKVVEVRASVSTSTDDMIIDLKQQAQSEGIDAVMLDNIGKQNNEAAVPAADGIVYQKLAGIGLRYKRTIDYMDSIFKQASVKVWMQGEVNPKEIELKFDFNGNCNPLKTDEADRLFNYDIYPYDAFDVNYAPQRKWEFKIDSTGRLLSKRMPLSDYASVTCNYNYDEIGSLKDVTVRTFADYADLKNIKQVLKVFYDSHGRVEHKELFEKNERKWIEEPVYYMSGKLMKIKRFKIVDGKKQLMMESDFTYYSNDDLPAAVNP